MAIINSGERKLNLYPNFRGNYTLASEIKPGAWQLERIDDLEPTLTVVNVGRVKIVVIALLLCHVCQTIHQTLSQPQNLRIRKMLRSIVSRLHDLCQWLHLFLYKKLLIALNAPLKCRLTDFCYHFMFRNECL